MTDIQKKVDEAMDSVLNIERANPGPFFYTRLQARINREEGSNWTRMSRLVTRPPFAFITISLLLMLNIFVALNETEFTSNKPDLAEVATADDLGINTFYDIENVQP